MTPRMPEFDLDVLQLVRVASPNSQDRSPSTPFLGLLVAAPSPTGLPNREPTTHRDHSQHGDRLRNSHGTLPDERYDLEQGLRCMML